MLDLNLSSDHALRSAALLYQSGQFAEAETICRQILIDHPQHASAHMLLGDALKAKKLGAEAFASYSVAIRCAPDSAAAFNARANLLTEMNGFDAALLDHRKALELSPKDIAFHLAMIGTLKVKGDFTEAERSARSLVEIDPAAAGVWESLGRILQITGQFEEAAHCLRKSLAIQPSGIVSMLLAKMPGQIEPADEQIIIGLQNNPDLPTEERIAAGFALGDVLDKADRFDEAFAAYESANALFKKMSAEVGIGFDRQELICNVESMIHSITPNYFQQRLDFGQPSDLPVFIVGMPRSGTSLVEQIAASHSKGFGAGELSEIALIRARMSETVPVESPRHWHRHWHRHLAKVHLATLAALGGGAERVVDKMPLNVLNLGLIATMFPGARVIFCHRDPRAVCLSCFFQKFEKHNLMFSYNLTDCAWQQREQDRLAEHWKQVLPIRMLSVRYEELVTDLESQSRRLIDFLGLDWEPGCLDFHKTNRPVLTKSVWQVRQPIYGSSINRWKKYQKHLGPVDAVLSNVSLG